MFEFYPQVEAALRSAGWLPGRLIDITKHEYLFTKEGYVLNETVRAVFQEFGDLDLKIPCSQSSVAHSYLNLSLVDAVDYMLPYSVQFLEKFTRGERLISIGLLSPYTRVFICTFGKIYCFDDDDDPFRCCGENIQDFLQGLYDGKAYDDYKRIEISDEEWDQYWNHFPEDT